MTWFFFGSGILSVLSVFFCNLLNSSPADVKLIGNQLNVHSIVYYAECNASIVIKQKTIYRQFLQLSEKKARNIDENLTIFFYALPFSMQ